MTTLGISEGNVGSGHVIMLEDGRFIVVDGGSCSCKVADAAVWCDHVDLIWNAMLNLYKKAYGANAEPTAQAPIHVAAWYLTHGHSDHYSAFNKMIKLINNDDAKKAIFKMDYIIANLPGANSLFENTTTTWGYSPDFANMQNYLGGIKLIKPYAGQKLYFANLEIEVLMTFGDHLPYRINNTNDTNTVARFNIGSTDKKTGVPGKTTSVMILGDSWRASSRFLCSMYGDYLKSDITQISHHGNIGAEKELYDKIAPTGVLFNNTKTDFKNYVWGDFSSETNPEKVNAHNVDKYVVTELSTVKYVYTADSGTKPTFAITTEGAQYDTAFDLVTDAALVYKTSSDAVGDQNGFIKNAGAHEHTYNLTKYNETYHMQKCDCGAVKDVAEHTAIDDNDCTTATVCTAENCGHVFVEARPNHTGGTATCIAMAHCEVCNKEYGDYGNCIFGDWKTDGDKHWKECVNCGTDTDEGTHSFGEWITDGDKHWKECTTCGAKKDEGAHSFGDWITNGDKHWKECACGTKKDEGTHSFGDWITNGEKHWKECTCGTKKDEGTHSFGDWITNGDKHWKECTCGTKNDEGTHSFGDWITNGDKHWKECTCGTKKDEGTHSFGDWITNADKHLKECACGAKKDEGAHNFGSDNVCDSCEYDKTVPHEHGNGIKKDGKTATCTAPGWKDYYQCSCGEYYTDAACTDKIESLEEWKNGAGKITADHNHNIPKFDETHHWDECVCGDKAEKHGHSFDNDSDELCDLCGYEREIQQPEPEPEPDPEPKPDLEPEPKPEVDVNNPILETIVDTIISVENLVKTIVKLIFKMIDLVNIFNFVK